MIFTVFSMPERLVALVSGSDHRFTNYPSITVAVWRGRGPKIHPTVTCPDLGVLGAVGEIKRVEIGRCKKIRKSAKFEKFAAVASSLRVRGE